LAWMKAIAATQPLPPSSPRSPRPVRRIWRSRARMSTMRTKSLAALRCAARREGPLQL
jgi:hypothetical protein